MLHNYKKCTSSIVRVSSINLYLRLCLVKKVLMECCSYCFVVATFWLLTFQALINLPLQCGLSSYLRIQTDSCLLQITGHIFLVSFVYRIPSSTEYCLSEDSECSWYGLHHLVFLFWILASLGWCFHCQFFLDSCLLTSTFIIGLAETRGDVTVLTPVCLWISWFCLNAYHSSEFYWLTN